MNLYLKEGHRREAKEEEFLQAVANALAGIIERKQAEDALRESEEKYRRLVERSNDGIAIIQDGIVKYGNRMLARMRGGTIEEIVGTPFTDFLHPEEVPKVVDYYKRRMAGEDVTPIYETCLKDKDGKNIYAELNASMITYQGKPADLVMIRDLTDRRRAQEALQESEERFRAVVEQSTDGIYLADAETKRIIEANPGFARMLGYPREEIIGLSIYDFIVADQADIDRRFQDILRGQAPVSYERPYRRKDGSLVDVGGSSTPISFGNKKAICVIVRDLTERKRTEEVLRESEERYRAVMEQSADGIYLVDVETKRLLEANPAFAQMLAYTTEEIVKLSVYDFVAADRRNIDQRFQNILSMEGSVASERQYRRKDGALLDVWVSVNVISCRGRKVMCTIARDITDRKRAGEEREKLIGELTEALDNIKTLRGLVPICASCKKIRDDQGYWQQVEVYVRDRSEAEFSHGLCPDCAKEFLSPINDRKGQEKE
jgi:PAS domain S-box-containing protein